MGFPREDVHTFRVPMSVPDFHDGWCQTFFFPAKGQEIKRFVNLVTDFTGQTPKIGELIIHHDDDNPCWIIQYHHGLSIIHCLVGGLDQSLYFHIVGISSSQLTNSNPFQRGWNSTTNQQSVSQHQLLPTLWCVWNGLKPFHIHHHVRIVYLYQHLPTCTLKICQFWTKWPL